MDEEDWPFAGSPLWMLGYRNVGKPSVRKIRLYMCGCCRLIWDFLPDELCRDRVESGERYADGLLSAHEHHQLTSRSSSGLRAGTTAYHAFLSTEYPITPAHLGMSTVHNCIEMTRRAVPSKRHRALAEAQTDLARDVFDASFFSPVFSPEWLTETVVELARGIYDDRAFDRMPILGDALEEDGCTSARILDHCRGPKPHARGCWVLDGVLGFA